MKRIILIFYIIFLSICTNAIGQAPNPTCNLEPPYNEYGSIYPYEYTVSNVYDTSGIVLKPIPRFEKEAQKLLKSKKLHTFYHARDAKEYNWVELYPLDFWELKKAYYELIDSCLFLYVAPGAKEAGGPSIRINVHDMKKLFIEPTKLGSEFKTIENLQSRITKILNGMGSVQVVRLKKKNHRYDYTFSVTGSQKNIFIDDEYWEKYDIKMSITPNWHGTGVVISIMLENAMYALPAKNKPNKNLYIKLDSDLNGWDTPVINFLSRIAVSLGKDINYVQP